jgi:thiol:disulfide interchange protein
VVQLLCSGAVATLLPLGAAADSSLAEGAFDRGEARVSGRLLVHPDDVPAAGPVRVGVRLEMDPGWHVYAPEPGDSGLPTELSWQLEGGRVGPIRWPRPSLFREGDGMLTTYGYAGDLFLPALAHLDPGAADDPVLRVAVEFLACNVQCLPGRFVLERRLGAAGLESAESVRAFFEPEAPQGQDGRGDGRSASLGVLLGLALLGGLLLNLMPCVLPVLALKAAGIAEWGGGTGRSRAAHALAYAAGVLTTLLALAGAVIGLRATGAQVGWGFQFQEPLFLAGLSLVLMLFAVNLLGGFEIEAGAGRLSSLGARDAGARRSFFDGLLAVLLATPCSAPYLGTAVGFGLAGSNLTIVAVFGCVGIGLAAPFVLLCLAPGTRRLLPRPGPWMVLLRQGLAFALLGTLVWLLWIAGRVMGADGVAVLLVLLWGVALVAWLYGLAQPRAPRVRLALGVALLGLCLGGVGVVSLESGGAGSVPAPERSESAPFDPAVLDAELARGQSIFVYFTADWCITCKLNEKRVLGDPRVVSELARPDVTVFRADWTRRDPEISRALAALGRAGVPTYAVQHPATRQPIVLPELLSVEGLIAALRASDAGASDELP